MSFCDVTIALTNIADNKGCYPLHLAAWKGDQRISSVEPKESKRCGPFDPYINAKPPPSRLPEPRLPKPSPALPCFASPPCHLSNAMSSEFTGPGLSEDQMFGEYACLSPDITIIITIIITIVIITWPRLLLASNPPDPPGVPGDGQDLSCPSPGTGTGTVTGTEGALLLLLLLRLLLLLSAEAGVLTDPTMRNNKFETPLDLAALYGRLDVVKLLLSAHPNLLGCNTKKHTPLHLASRNGHLCVVEVNIVDFKGLTALDTVRDMPSQKSRQIAALMQGHMAGKPPDIDLPPPPIPPPHESPSPRKKGDLDKMSALISGMAPGPEEESPYEALYEATSCHSLDSLASGKSSDRDSGRPDSDAGKKDRLGYPPHPVHGHEEDVSSEALYTRGCIDERGEPAEEDEDHTYELLFSARTKTPPPGHKTTPHRADGSQPSEDPSAAAAAAAAPVPEQFTGLLHGSSPVFECHEEPFRLPGPGPGGQQPKPDAVAVAATAKAADVAKAKAQATPTSTTTTTSPPVVAAAAAAAAATPSPPRPNMAAILSDRDPKAIYATVSKEPRDGGGGSGGSPVGRLRPPGDLKLARSLSKSDSDLLVSPPSEEEGGCCLGSRSESVSNCSAGKKRLEKSPSFTSEWDEIEKIMTLIGAGIDFSRDQQYATPGAAAAGRLLGQPVGDWLEHVGLPQYESKLLLNGFDDLHYMEQDLREIGITDPGHRRKILHAARSLPKVKALGCDGNTSLSSWLDSLGLQEYLHNFLASGYRTLDCVKNLWELEIVNVLKISLLGHQETQSSASLQSRARTMEALP
ncbi:hypothetical protein CRUP_026247, partial [Coryphaenoides rupestris]